jgi:hypothetical protein
MVLSRDSRLANAAHGRYLPPHWRTLDEITRLPDEQFYAMLADGRINPDMQRKDVSRENRLITQARHWLERRQPRAPKSERHSTRRPASVAAMIPYLFLMGIV